VADYVDDILDGEMDGEHIDLRTCRRRDLTHRCPSVHCVRRTWHL